MKILILEDSPVRTKTFEEMFQDVKPSITDWTGLCIELLKNGNWDILFLDHDLDGKANVESGPGTGYEIACYLAKNPDRAPKLIVVHSHNVKGGTKMMQMMENLKNVHRLWFGQFTRDDVLRLIDFSTN